MIGTDVMKTLAYCDFKNPNTVYPFARLALLLESHVSQVSFVINILSGFKSWISASLPRFSLIESWSWLLMLRS